jgi:Phage tail lysozyme
MARLLCRCALGLSLALLASCVGATGEELGRTRQALETYPNERPAFDFFRGKGLTNEQAAGIVGNLDVESGLDPAIVQSGGPGRGIAQWSAGARWDTTPGDNVKAYAAQQGKSALSLQLQLDFIWFELTTFPGYGLTKLKATTTLSAAVTSFATNYEGCGSCSTSMRVAHGQSVLDRFGGTPVDAGSSSGEPAGDACSVQPMGVSGVCITTAACSALGDHVSTAGFCPGADDVQCCTAAPGGTSSGDGGGPGTSKSSAGTDDGAGGCSSSRRAPPEPTSAVLVLGAALLVAMRRRSRG